MLPAEWTKKEDLAPVTLYGMFLSPPCIKIRVILDHYKVPFTHVDGKKPDSAYTKIPVLDVKDVQINDSYAMVLALAPVLQGAALTAEEVELEKLNTFGLMLALEAGAANEPCGAGLRKCGCNVAPRLGCFGCCICFVFTCCGPCLSCAIGPGMKPKFDEKCQKHVGAPLASAEDYGKQYGKKLGNKKFFNGDEIGIIDCSIYGHVMPFAEAGTTAGEDFLADPAIGVWYSRMHEALGVDFFSAKA